jgi:hypothetical protein
METARAILAQRSVALQAVKAKLPNSTSSIENNVSNNTSSISIELPGEIEKLIVGEMFRQARINRYKKLIREGHLDNLLRLAAIAATKTNPAHWFARAAGKVKWNETLAFLAKTAKVVKTQCHLEVLVRVGLSWMRAPDLGDCA